MVKFVRGFILLQFLLAFLLLQLRLVNSKRGACAICKCYNRASASGLPTASIYKHVDCSYLGLTAIPANISIKTHHLHLQGNNIPDVGITSGFPYYLPNLRVLYLYNNPIETIAPGAFVNVGHIHTLLLHFTALGGVDPGVFSNMTHLKWLWLNDIPRLSYVDPLAFRSSPNIIDLHLENGNLTTIANGTFLDNGNLQHLYLYNNPIMPVIPGCCALCGVPPAADLRWGMVPWDINSYALQMSCGKLARG
jgi:hypothetical protein